MEQVNSPLGEGDVEDSLLNVDRCDGEDPPYLDNNGVELLTDDLVYVTQDVTRFFREQETHLAAGSLAIIYSFPRPGKAMISATFIDGTTGRRVSAKKIVPRAILVRLARRFMRMKVEEYYGTMSVNQQT